MSEQLIELTEMEGMMEPEILKMKLESFNIPCLLRFETAGRLMGITMNGLGKVKVMVAPEDYDRALDILNSTNEFDDDSEPQENEQEDEQEDEQDDERQP